MGGLSMIGREKEALYKALTESNDVYALARKIRLNVDKGNPQMIELEQRASNLLDILSELYNSECPYSR